MYRILLKAIYLNCILIGLFGFSPCEAAEPIAVPTFHSIGLYYSPIDGSENNACLVEYKIVGESDWKKGQDLWFDARNSEYRGSLVNLIPGVSYMIRVTLAQTGDSHSITASTWKEAFPVGDTVYLPAGTTGETIVVNESGTAGAYRLITHPQGAQSIIDVNNQADYCLEISASYVIIRGLVLKNAAIHGVRLLPGAHNVVIENCDISGWGRIAADGWGVNEDAGIFSSSADIERIIIQRNRIHHPRSDSNNWAEERVVGANGETSDHPAGPKAIVLKASAGNHVIRYNEIYTDDDHYFNDIIGEDGNFGPGFPNADTDIYGNYLERCWDDGIESEGHNRNVRIWNNYIDHTAVGIAIVPVHQGPLYMWRNVMHRSRKSPYPNKNHGWPLIKIGGGQDDGGPYYGDGKTYIFHNTSLIPPLSSAVDGHSTQIDANERELKNCVTRNNIFESDSDLHAVIMNKTEGPQNDFDWDLFNGYIHWGDDIFELNGIQGHPVYTAKLGFDSAEGTGNFQQKASSPGYDAGTPIANFNDDYIGDAPDMGAHESGSSPMRFGVTANNQNPRGLVGWWQFDESTLFTGVIDKSGYGNHGVIYGDTLRQAGVHGSAVSFDGNNDYVVMADPGQSSLDVTDDLTISMWVKRSQDTAGDQWFLTKSGSYAWKFSNGRPYFFIYTPHLSVIESSPIPKNEWHHLAAVYDSSKQEVRIFIKGVLDTVHPVSGSIATSNQGLFFGHPSNAGFLGFLDNTQIYDRVLGQDEIYELAGLKPDTSLAANFDMEEGQGNVVNDISGNGNTGTLFGDTAWVPGKSGTALAFDGDFDSVDIADSSGSLTIEGDFTVALWINRTGSTLGDEWFFSKSGTYAWKISNNTPYFLIWTPEVRVVTPSQIGLNQWYHLVAVYDQTGQSVTIYIDGEADTTEAVGGQLNLTTDNHILGHNSDACLTGLMDEVMVYSKALTLAEVRALYGQQHGTSLTGHWALDEGAGTVGQDTSGNGNHGALLGEAGWVAGKSGTAVSFDGDYDYVTITDTTGDLEIHRDLSISLWMKRTAGTAGDEWFINKSGEFAWKLSNNIPYFFIYTPDLILVDASPIGLNEWHHLAAVYDTTAETVSIYIDGLLSNSQTVSGEIPTTQSDLILGAGSDAGMIGILDDIRIYNDVLSAEEINQLFLGN